jgi:HSP20 family protein
VGRRPVKDKLEDVRVEVTNDQLVIQGERKYEQEENKEGLYRSERRYGHFYHAIPLPDGANTEQAKAEFKNGRAGDLDCNA